MNTRLLVGIILIISYEYEGKNGVLIVFGHAKL